MHNNSKPKLDSAQQGVQFVFDFGSEADSPVLKWDAVLGNTARLSSATNSPSPAPGLQHHRNGAVHNWEPSVDI